MIFLINLIELVAIYNKLTFAEEFSHEYFSFVWQNIIKLKCMYLCPTLNLLQIIRHAKMQHVMVSKKKQQQLSWSVDIPPKNILIDRYNWGLENFLKKFSTVKSSTFHSTSVSYLQGFRSRDIHVYQKSLHLYLWNKKILVSLDEVLSVPRILNWSTELCSLLAIYKWLSVNFITLFPLG